MVLKPFSRPPCRLKATAEVSFNKGGAVFRYALSGDIDEVVLAPLSHPRPRKDGLWKSTCFEAFLCPGPGPEYVELNFSPSGAWNAYRFDSYRKGMTRVKVAPPRMTVRRTKTAYALAASIPLQASRIGLTSVLALQDGATTYWSLLHPAPKPDFHDPRGWALTIRDH